MSRLTTALATSHTLSLAAMEEASRVGARTAEVEHLFLALVLSEQPAGQVLRSLGITLDSARAAIAAQHAEQLASVGVTVEAPPAGPIVFHETGGYEWGERPLAVLHQASSGARSGDAAAVLRACVAEPSGFVEAVLLRLGTSRDAVTGRLDELERFSPARAPQAGPSRGSEARLHRLTARGEAFVPAPPAEVWALLADVARIPEWDDAIGSIEARAEAPAGAPLGSVFEASAQTQGPDGRPLRMKAALRRIRIDVTAVDAPHEIAWRYTYPDAPRANARVVRVALEPAAGGTRLRTEIEWVPVEAGAGAEPHAGSPEASTGGPERHVPISHALRAALRPPLRILLRPLHRYALWMQVQHLGSSIARVFRQS